MFRVSFLVALTAGLASSAGWAGTATEAPGKESKQIEQTEKQPLDSVQIDFQFTNSASLRGANGGKGDQNAMYSSFGYARRIPISGNFYARLGLDYERFDFGTTQQPVPSHFQGLYFPVALDYLYKGVQAATLEADPGFWYQDNIRSRAFDIPWKAYVTVPTWDKKLFAVVGAGGAGFYSIHVLPVGGLIYLYSDQTRLELVFPHPSLVYSPSADWEYRLEAEIVGGGFRTDDNKDVRYRDTVAEYTDYHGGALVTYKGFKPFNIALGAGWSFQREFDYFRSAKRFDTTGAPYAKLQITTNF